MPGSAEQRRKELAWQDGKAVGNRLYRGDDFVWLRRVFLVSPKRLNALPDLIEEITDLLEALRREVESRTRPISPDQCTN